METGVSTTLKQRGEVYGDYRGGSELRAQIMALIKYRFFYVNCRGMSEFEATIIYDIVNKLSRLAVSPSHIDTWHDISGYATLVELMLKEELDGKA
ncbi:MAG: hypothetical protein JHC33_11115 [Ignisphaera sp.]|nr:hypothetical protein [Ignisphaera sp.]